MTVRDHHLDQAHEHRAEEGDVLAEPGATSPTMTPAITAMMTAMRSQWCGWPSAWRRRGEFFDPAAMGVYLH